MGLAEGPPGNGDEPVTGFIPGVVRRFLSGRLSVLLILLAVSLGTAAILLTPREEEPQIVVPLADVFVAFPGASAAEVEKLVATPLERLLWQIDGVEYVYSVSSCERAVVTVRFYVGEDRERSLVKLHNRIQAHIDEVPPGVTGWVVKPIEIDDVPIVTLSLFSKGVEDPVLRRIAEEVRARLDAVKNISRTRIVGGRPLEVRVELSPETAAARGVSALDVYQALRAADTALAAGDFSRNNRSFKVHSGPFLRSVEDVGDLVVAVHEGRPVYVRDVARVNEIPREALNYTRIGLGPADPAGEGGRGETFPAVTLAVAKKKGTNAVGVAQEVLEKIEELRRDVIPSDVQVVVTRNYGQTADDKVNELLKSLVFAMVTVVGLLLFTLGWREGLIVALAVPVSFALALFVNFIFGYTINRVTLFALILTLGLVVDDPIANVDNIQRHILMRRRNPHDATLAAVKELLPPVILSTLAIVVSFLPMFFITGMMGPYMQPMAINVPLTVAFSTLAALSIVPWAAHGLLKGKGAGGTEPAAPSRGAAVPGWIRSFYRVLLTPFLRERRMRVGLLLLVLFLLGASAFLVLTRRVPMKMLPFDNKNELQLVVDMPEGTTLETTDAVVRALESELFAVPEIEHFQSYVGTHSPLDFNGLVRHYYFRENRYQADIRIGLAPKNKRVQQSHEIALRIRPGLTEVAQRHGATLLIVESPPGPPVVATVTVEVVGPADASYAELIDASRTVMERMREEPGIVDLDSTVAARHMRVDFELDKEKAGLHGIPADAVVRTLRFALEGGVPATVHKDGERTPLVLRLQLPRPERSGIEELGRVRVKGQGGELVELREIGVFREVPGEQPIFHKNLERVVYVFAEAAGRAPAEAILDLVSHFKKNPLPGDIRLEWAGEGEWKITLDVFRDLGLAFGAAMIGIYILLVIQTASYLMPLVIMTSIPLTAVGIIPGFWLLNLLTGKPVGPFENPVFFTATGMIGMIALGGIVVRNAIVLIDFIQSSLQEGTPVREAILESGAVRMRPILLTAATTALGAWPITLDPIFSGLAWALIFGLFASTAFTLVVVPVTFYAIYGPRLEAARAEAASRPGKPPLPEEPGLPPG